MYRTRISKRPDRRSNRNEMDTEENRRPESRRGTKLNPLLIFGLIAAFLFCGMLLSQRFAPPARVAGEEIDTRPVLLSVREIGKLHSATMNFKDAMKYSSDQRVAGWMKDIPGAEDVAKWATHNEVIIVAEGSVEAGVDLSKLGESDFTKRKNPDGAVQVEVKLPPVDIYPAEVKVHVENNKPGLFWKDENIIPKAQAEAGRRFREAAEREQIRQKAEASVLKTLENLQQGSGWKNVTFKF